MAAEVVAPSFIEFLAGELLRAASDPYDAMTVHARCKLGPLGVNDQLVYVPSLLLGGAENVDHVQRMSARAAMICNGDIAIQLALGPADGVVSGVETYTDEQQRMRLRLVWG